MRRTSLNKRRPKKNSNKTIIFENVYLIVFENTHMVIRRIEMFENRRKTLIELFLQLQPISKIIQKLSFHPKISKLGISFAIRTDN